MYWSRPDVARAHGASNWPQRCAPRGTLNAIPTAAKAVAPEGAAAAPEDPDSEPCAMQSFKKLDIVQSSRGELVCCGFQDRLCLCWCPSSHLSIAPIN